jgi:hypothetical protein
MTREEHIARHGMLHAALDELLADWITHSPRDGPTRLPSEHKIMALLEWSHQQTIEPTLRPGEKHAVPSKRSRGQKQAELVVWAERALPFLAAHVSMTPDEGPSDRIVHDKIEELVKALKT